jgi:NACalpha-BTF3-like transcription factor
MAVEVSDIRFTEQTDIKYKNNTYHFETGDVGTFDRSYAKKLVQRFHVAQYANKSYEVTEPEFEGVIGLKENYDEDEPVQEESDSVDYSYDELQEMAKDAGIKANQSREELEKALEV